MRGSRYRPATVWLASVGLLCFLSTGTALPYPDFGIPGPVASSAKVQTAAINLSADFDNVDEYGIELMSTYTALATIRDTLYAISDGVANAGLAIGSAFTTLATNGGPSINDVFNAASGAVSSMETLLSTGFTAEFTTLEGIIGTYVTDEFRDSFAAMLGSLTLLREAVARLKPAVQQAKTASKNSATIAPTLINRYVTSKMVLDVLEGLHKTRADVQVITYTVSNTLGKLEVADVFINEITAQAETEIGSVESTFDAYAGTTTEAVGIISDTLVQDMLDGYAFETEAIDLLQGDLAANDDYTTNFLPRMTTIDELLGTDARASFGLDVTDRFDTYLGQLAAIDDDTSTFFSDDTCLTIFEMVHVLVDNGPYSTFCFEKYSPLAFNLFPLFATLVAECYDDESINFDSLYVAVQTLVQLILFDVEDLAEALTICNSYPSDALCFSMISPLYETLLVLTATKRYYILELMMHETNASVYRFSACYYTQKFALLQAMYELQAGVNLCKEEGPAA